MRPSFDLCVALGYPAVDVVAHALDHAVIHMPCIDVVEGYFSEVVVHADGGQVVKCAAAVAVEMLRYEFLACGRHKSLPLPVEVDSYVAHGLRLSRFGDVRSMCVALLGVLLLGRDITLSRSLRHGQVHASRLHQLLGIVHDAPHLFLALGVCGYEVSHGLRKVCLLGVVYLAADAAPGVAESPSAHSVGLPQPALGLRPRYRIAYGLDA